MKKILYILAGITAMIVTASCARENVPAAKGDAATATFTIALPDQVATKAISDGLTAKNLLFYVYDENGKYLPELTIDDKTFTDKKTTINVQLVKGLKYSFGFIAVADGNASSAYAFDPATKAITVDYSKMTANDDQFDLFTAALNDFEVTGPFSQTITLTRPLAQVNFGTTEEDINAAKASGILTDDMKTALTFSEVGSAMNFLTGEVTATAQDVLVAAKVRPAETLTVNGTAYDWVAMSYVLTGADKALNDVSLDAEIANADGPMTPLQRSVANVPIQRNHRTNIIGNLFSVTGEFIIIIDEIFETPDYDYTNTLQLAFFKGGEVTLEKDEVIEHQLVVPAGSNVILNLNGYTISNTEDIWAGDNWSLISVQGGSLTIKGEGKLDAKENDCYALDIRDGGSLIVEGGEIIGNITAVYVYEGTADIRGGKFDLKQLSSGTGEAPYRYMINLLDAAGRDGSASAIVSGGSFYMFNPGNNAAEGAGTNFLIAGKTATLQDGWYTVESAKIPVADGVTTDGTGNYTITSDVEGTLKNALDHAVANNFTDPVIDLESDILQNITAWDGSNNALALASEATNSITINGNEHTINFCNKNSDWNNVATNDTKLILKNLKLTNSGYNDGPWNRHDINFNCDVVLENVTSDKAIALKKNGTLKNVSIKDQRSSEDYGIWIQANGQTVELDGCIIDESSTGDRTLKIDDQYVDSPALVTLSVSNTIFKSAKKSAVLVKNSAGAKIIWGEGNDISGVAADSENAVWNDSDRADVYDLVEVIGCAKKQE